MECKCKKVLADGIEKMRSLGTKWNVNSYKVSTAVFAFMVL